MFVSNVLLAWPSIPSVCSWAGLVLLMGALPCCVELTDLQSLIWLPAWAAGGGCWCSFCMNVCISSTFYAVLKILLGRSCQRCCASVRMMLAFQTRIWDGCTLLRHASMWFESVLFCEQGHALLILKLPEACCSTAWSSCGCCMCTSRRCNLRKWFLFSIFGGQLQPEESCRAIASRARGTCSCKLCKSCLAWQACNPT